MDVRNIIAKLGNLYLCMFCFAVSLWGVIMLLVLGISCKFRAVALFEDVNIDEERQNLTNFPEYTRGDGKAFSLRKDNVDDAYNNAAWSCFGAAVLYGFFLILSTVFIIYHQQKKVGS